jgi:hypothetical protein
MDTIENCPQCGETMETGTVGVMSYVGGAAWYRERSTLALGGRPIVRSSLGGMIWLDGRRCPRCRELHLRY